MEPILKVADLSKAFSRAGRDAFFAVDHVSFEVQPGKILGIVGESGSGKSTIARLITRQIDATGGQVFIDGQDITRLRGRDLIPVYAKIQMVFQSPADSFDPRRTLGERHLRSLRNKGVPKAEREAKARALLESCGLPGHVSRALPHQVSGGQCQRAAIARALMNDPRILIFDEATSALDVTVQKQIIEPSAAAAEGKEAGLSLHLPQHRAGTAVCDRVIVLHDGRIVESGLPDEVILHPAVGLHQTGLSTLFSERQSLAVFPGTAQTCGLTDRLVRPPPR